MTRDKAVFFAVGAVLAILMIAINPALIGRKFHSDHAVTP